MTEATTTEDTGTDLITIPHKTDVPAMFSKPGAIEGLVTAIEKQARAIVTDHTTAKGRKEIKTLASKVSRSKTLIDEVGKEENDERNRLNKAVNAQRNLAKERLDALRDEIKAPVVAWEDAEAERTRQHLIRLDEFDQGRVDAHSDTATIKGVIAHVEAIDVDETWEEHEADAKTAKAAALSKWQSDLAIAQAREDQAAELEALRAEKEQRDQEKAERAIADRKAADAAEAEARAQAAAQAQADAAREQARKDAEAAEERHKAELIEAAKREERAAQAERDRIAAEKQAEEDAANARAADKKHRQKIRSEVVADIAALKPANVEEIVDAMMSGEISHVEVKL